MKPEKIVKKENPKEQESQEVKRKRIMTKWFDKVMQESAAEANRKPPYKKEFQYL